MLSYDSMRTIVDLPKQYLDRLFEISRSLNVSRAEVVRRAVSEYFKNMHAFSEKEKLAFGIWKTKKGSSLTYQNKLRGEWKN